MPRQLLVDRFCAYAKVRLGEDQTDYFDTGSASRGLALRVTKAGTKSWTYNFTWAGKRARMTFGTYPAISLTSARSRAKEAAAALVAKTDPRTALAQPETFQAVCEAWVTREAGTLRTGKDRKAALARLVYPILGPRPIAEIRRSDIVKLLDTIQDERGPAMADKTLAIIRRVFNWHASRSDDFRSPIVRGMARTKSGDRSRSRILTDDELRVVWRTAEGQGAFGRLVRFLLLTGARRTEAAAMPWAELVGGDWTLPGPRNKTKLDLLRPLPPAALDVIGTKPDRAVFVFSNNNGVGQIRGYPCETFVSISRSRNSFAINNAFTASRASPPQAAIASSAAASNRSSSDCELDAEAFGIVQFQVDGMTFGCSHYVLIESSYSLFSPEFQASI